METGDQIQTFQPNQTQFNIPQIFNPPQQQQQQEEHIISSSSPHLSQLQLQNQNQAQNNHQYQPIPILNEIFQSAQKQKSLQTNESFEESSSSQPTQFVSETQESYNSDDLDKNNLLEVRTYELFPQTELNQSSDESENIQSSFTGFIDLRNHVQEEEAQKTAEQLSVHFVENISKRLNDEIVSTFQSEEIVNSLMGEFSQQAANTVANVFKTTVIPTYERSTKEMFVQISNSFNKSFREKVSESQNSTKQLLGSALDQYQNSIKSNFDQLEQLTELLVKTNKELSSFREREIQKEKQIKALEQQLVEQKVIINQMKEKFDNLLALQSNTTSFNGVLGSSSSSLSSFSSQEHSNSVSHSNNNNNSNNNSNSNNNNSNNNPTPQIFSIQQQQQQHHQHQQQQHQQLQQHHQQPQIPIQPILQQQQQQQPIIQQQPIVQQPPIVQQLPQQPVSQFVPVTSIPPSTLPATTTEIPSLQPSPQQTLQQLIQQLQQQQFQQSQQNQQNQQNQSLQMLMLQLLQPQLSSQQQQIPPQQVPPQQIPPQQIPPQQIPPQQIPPQQVPPQQVPPQQIPQQQIPPQQVPQQQFPPQQFPPQQFPPQQFPQQQFPPQQFPPQQFPQQQFPQQQQQFPQQVSQQIPQQQQPQFQSAYGSQPTTPVSPSVQKESIINHSPLPFQSKINVVQSSVSPLNTGTARTATTTTSPSPTPSPSANQDRLNSSVQQQTTLEFSSFLDPANVSVQTLETVCAVNEHLLGYRYSDAFVKALEAKDVRIVLHLCANINPSLFFSNNPIPISQSIILSLIQQLTYAIKEERTQKIALSWIRFALCSLNTKDKSVVNHVKFVFEPLAKRIQECFTQISSAEILQELESIQSLLNTTTI